MVGWLLSQRLTDIIVGRNVRHDHGLFLIFPHCNDGRGWVQASEWDKTEDRVGWVGSR